MGPQATCSHFRPELEAAKARLETLLQGVRRELFELLGGYELSRIQVPPPMRRHVEDPGPHAHTQVAKSLMGAWPGLAWHAP